MEDKEITSRDLARILGISQSTVSRALGDSPRVSAATRARVRSEATRLGYQPNALARGLSTRQTNLVGVVLSDSPGPFVTEMVRYLSQSLERHGRRILLLHASNIADADMALQTLVAFRVDGVLFVSSVRRSQLPQKCLAAGIPHVLIDRSYDKVASPVVETDNIAGGRLVGDLFTAGGHRDLAYMVGREDSPSSIAREQGFREALACAGVTQIRRMIGRYTHDDGYVAGKALLQSGKPPTAVFCASDTMALGVLDAARDLGVQVPDQLSVVGYDDIPQAAWSPYRLTTVRQRYREMAVIAVDMLFERISRLDLPAEHRLMAPELAMRDSYRPLPLAQVG